jgi:polysaccharide pyruvyl transferase WcaK-like protein
MGYGNLGDAATQDALIANIRRRVPEAVFIGFSLNPDDTRNRHHIPCYPITWWHPGLNKPAEASPQGQRRRSRLKVLLQRVPLVRAAARRAWHLAQEAAHIGRSYKVLRSLDSLIIAGGGQLGDLWRGPWSHPYNVLKFAVLAKIARKRLIFINVGAGPLRHPLSRLFVRSSIRLADYVSFRDIESQQLVRSLGVKTTTHVFPDSVYALEMPEQETIRPEASHPLVGLNPIGFADPRIWPRQDAAVYSSYLDKLVAFSSWLLARNYRLKIFSAELSVDVHAIEDLKRRLQSSLPREMVDEIVGAPSKQVNDLIAEMSEFDFVVTSKFHGVVFSHLLAKPVIALSYHNKIDDLMRAAGHGQYCLNIEGFDVEHLKSVFASLVEDAADLKSRFHDVAAARAETSRLQFDKVLIPEYLQARPTGFAVRLKASIGLARRALATLR